MPHRRTCTSKGNLLSMLAAALVVVLVAALRVVALRVAVLRVAALREAVPVVALVPVILIMKRWRTLIRGL